LCAVLRGARDTSYESSTSFDTSQLMPRGHIQMHYRTCSITASTTCQNKPLQATTA
jgi:hypothetical protein